MNQFLKLYRDIENPLENDEAIAKVVKAYITARKYGNTNFYNEIVKIGTNKKTTNPPPQIEKDKFWSTLFNKWKSSILNNKGKINEEKYEGHLSEIAMILKDIPNTSTYNEVCDIADKYPIISKYGIMPSGDRLWNFILSRNINGTKENDITPNYRLYINSEASDTYQILAGFIGKCYKKQLPYYLKFIEVPDDYKDRADSIVIWADEKTLFQYIRILNELQKEIPNIVARCNEPPILTKKLNNWIGFGEEPNEGSYTTARTKLLEDSIKKAMNEWIIENQNKKFTFGKSKFSIKEYITARSIKREFEIIKETKSPKAFARYGVKRDELNRDLYIELCNDVIDEVIPTIENNNYRINYNKDGRRLSFDLDSPIEKLLGMIIDADTENKDIIGKIRKNIKLDSKKYGIDAEKFIFNDDYLSRIIEQERETK